MTIALTKEGNTNESKSPRITKGIENESTLNLVVDIELGRYEIFPLTCTAPIL